MALFDEIYNNKNAMQMIEDAEVCEAIEKLGESKKRKNKSKTISEKDKVIKFLKSVIKYIQSEDDVNPDDIKIIISIGKKYRCKYKGSNVKCSIPDELKDIIKPYKKGGYTFKDTPGGTITRK